MLLLFIGFTLCYLNIGEHNYSLNTGLEASSTGPLLSKQYYDAKLGHNIVKLDKHEVTTVRFTGQSQYNVFVVFHSVNFINESSKRRISNCLMNPISVSVLTNEYNLEFSVFHLEKSCIIKYSFNYFKSVYLSSDVTKENSVYCILHSSKYDVTTTLYKDPETSSTNSFYYYDSYTMRDPMTEVRDEYTPVKDKKSIILKYSVGQGNKYGLVGIYQTTSRYVNGKFNYPDVAKIPNAIQLKMKQLKQLNPMPPTNNKKIATFGRNSAKVSSERETTIETFSLPGKTTFVAFLNYDDFTFSGVSEPGVVISSPGTFKVIAKDKERILDFVVFAVDTKGSTIDVIINQDKKQYLIDCGLKYLPSQQLIVFIGSEEHNIMTYLSKKIIDKENYKIEVHSSYKMIDEPETIMSPKLYENVTFKIFKVFIGEVIEDSYIGILNISRQNDENNASISGNYQIPSYNRVFTNPTSYNEKSLFLLRSNSYHKKITTLCERTPIKLHANTLIAFETANVDGYFIMAQSGKTKLNITDKKLQALIVKDETELNITITNNNKLTRVPINIYRLDHLKYKCKDMIISGGSQDITLCSNKSYSSKCTHVISKENKTCIFKSFNSRYSSAIINVSSMEFVEFFSPKGVPIKNSLEDSSLSIGSYFVSVINPPEDIDKKEFFFSAVISNKNREIESPYQIENDAIYKFEAKYKYRAGPIVGSLVSCIVVVSIAVYFIIYYKKKYDSNVFKYSESTDSRPMYSQSDSESLSAAPVF